MEGLEPMPLDAVYITHSAKACTAYHIRPVSYVMQNSVTISLLLLTIFRFLRRTCRGLRSTAHTKTLSRYRSILGAQQTSLGRSRKKKKFYGLDE